MLLIIQNLQRTQVSIQGLIIHDQLSFLIIRGCSQVFVVSKPEAHKMIIKYSVPTAKKTQSISIAEIKWFILLRK